MIKNFKIVLIAASLVYACGIAFSYYYNTQFKQKVDAFDLDKNGFINNEEITEESKSVVLEMAKRKTTDQTVILLIPFSLIIGFFVFGIAYLFRKIRFINDNEILYRNNK